MTAYFIFRLVLDGIITIILINLLLRTSRAFKVTRAKTPYVLYVPTVISVVLILQVYFYFGPKLIDAVRLFGGTAFYAQVEVEHMRTLPGGFTDTDGNDFYFNPLSFDAAVGDKLTLRYLPNSGFIIQANTTGTATEEANGDTN